MTGERLADHVRHDLADGTKRVRWRRPDGTWRLPDGVGVADLAFYPARPVTAGSPDAAILVVEGEPAADAAASIYPGPVLGTVTGAGAIPGPAALDALRGRLVLVWPDADAAGHRHATNLAEALHGIAGAVRVIEPPTGATEGWDLADAVADGWDAVRLTAFLEETPSARPTIEPAASPPQLAARGPAWPARLQPEARHGLAGEVLATIEPYSEADPAAILGHLLIATGTMIGPTCHAIAGDAVHPARLFGVLVGETAKGRKDSARAPIRRLVHLADPGFAAREVEGLSSAEGLIWQVRDPIERYERPAKGQPAELVEVDPGVKDKRLLVVETEFASVLKMVQREGNALSPMIRRAWDSGELRTLTKNSPAVATGAHIGIIGHISRDELLRYLDRSELANGFANRFLWVAVRRARLLPDGEGVPEEVLRPLAQQLAGVRTWAQTARRLRRDKQADELWREVYGQLSEGAPGMFGGATSRAEAQVLRLSVLYAIADRSETIRVAHLHAALAVWQYALESARWVFGEALGDPVADSIRVQLRQAGELSRGDMYEFLGGTMGRARLDRALGVLLTAGVAVPVRLPSAGGRPREVWRPTPTRLDFSPFSPVLGDPVSEAITASKDEKKGRKVDSARVMEKSDEEGNREKREESPEPPADELDTRTLISQVFLDEWLPAAGDGGAPDPAPDDWVDVESPQPLHRPEAPTLWDVP